jgi:2-(1,2-epoxy-1,2-dihydrophenyl)acetyl-CoA isomerase
VGVSDAPVLVATAGGVATVTLNRPQRLNALNGAMLDGLADALRRLARDEAVRVVVLTGAGRGFCAGGDVHDLATPPSGGARPSRSARASMEIDELLHGMAKPTLAAVNGPCAGAGLSFAAACDLRYAARSAVFTTAFLAVGMSGDHGGIWTVTRAVGAAKARELFLLGDRVDADEAQRIGLVHRAVPDAELTGVVAETAGRLAAAPAHVVAAMKANLNDALELGLAPYLDKETDRFEAVLAHPDGRALAQSFLDRRST